MSNFERGLSLSFKLATEWQIRNLSEAADVEENHDTTSVRFGYLAGGNYIGFHFFCPVQTAMLGSEKLIIRCFIRK